MGRMLVRIRKFLRNIFILKYVSQGFIQRNVEEWLRIIENEKLKKRKAIIKSQKKKSTTKIKHEQFKQVKIAHKKGFRYSTVRKHKLDDEQMITYVSQKEYLYIMPINQIYQKWLNNLVTMYNMLYPFHEEMYKYYYHLTLRDKKRFVISFAEGVNSFCYEDLKRDLMNEKYLKVLSVKGEMIFRISYNGKGFFMRGKLVEFSKIQDWIERTKKEYIIVEDVESKYKKKRKADLLLYVVNENGDNPKILDGIYWRKRKIRKVVENGDLKETISNWDAIVQYIEMLGKYLPQIEYMGVEIKIVGDDFYIHRMINRPEYFIRFKPSDMLTSYLTRKLEEKKKMYKVPYNSMKRGGETIKRFVRKKYAKVFYPKGLLPYLSYTWQKDIWKDFFTQKELSVKEKIYAYKNGYLSYRLIQYNITEETRYQYISDFEYKWLRHINPSYRVWLEDKNTIKYIVSRYQESFPEYYYYVRYKNGFVKLLGLQDCPKDRGNSYDDVLELIKERKLIALKPEEGTHGDGFYRCEYIDGEYYLNFQKVDGQDIINVLSNEEHAYIINEYINMHPDIKKMYSGSVNTLRVIVFKKDGRTSQIGNVYMRMGTSSTGAIDNMSAGGLFVAVDENTGEYGDAKQFIDGNIVDCPFHPDTGVAMEGVLPNWELTKKLVLDIANELKQLEFFGFDLAITEEGIKILEINRSPDYPRIEKYSQITNDYLLERLKMKKQGYKQDVTRTGKLVKLPKRE